MAKKERSIEEIEKEISVFERYEKEIPESLQSERNKALQNRDIDNIPQMIEDQLLFLFNDIQKKMAFELIYIPEIGLKVREIDVKKKMVTNPFELDKKFLFKEAFRLYRKILFDDHDKIELLKYYGYCSKSEAHDFCKRLTKQMIFASAQFVSRSKQNKGKFTGILVRKKHLIEIESTNTHNAYVEYYVRKLEFTLNDMYKLFERAMARIHGQGQNVNVTLIDQTVEEFLRDEETCLRDALANNERKFIEKKNNT
ncbi:MAG: hypothetical protein ACRC77_10275 [Bacteroidales bacterium]